MLRIFIFSLITCITVCSYSQTWTKKADFVALGRINFGAFSVNGKGYIVAGWDRLNAFSDMHEYDPVINTWTKKKDFPGANRRSTIGIANDTAGFAGLGWDGSTTYTDFYMYNPSKDTWDTLSSFPGVNRRNTFYSILDGKIYVGGGNGGVSGTNGIASKELWEYDISTDVWIQKASMPVSASARTGAIAFTIDSLIYIGFGHNFSNDLNDLWAYNTQTNSWSKKASYPGVGRLWPSVFVINGKAIVGGGHRFGQGTSSALDDYYEYDPVNDAWVSITGFSKGRRSVARGMSIGCKGYIIMGEDSSGAILKDIWEFSPNDLMGNIDSLRHVSCKGSSSGAAFISASGGIPPYTYLWPSGSTESADTALAVGSYIVTITDSMLYNDTILIIINEPPALLATANVIKHVSAHGGNDGSATVSANGGTPPYSYLWPSGQTNSKDSALIAGTYIVTVTDANLCEDTALVTIKEPIITSIKETLNDKQDQFVFYPLPNRGRFNFRLDKNNSSSINIIIYNNTGKLIYDNVLKEVGSREHTIDLGEVPSGIYYFQLFIEGQKYSGAIPIIK